MDDAGHLINPLIVEGQIHGGLAQGIGQALIEEVVWLGDTPVATLRPKTGGGVNIFYIHTDHLNAPRRRLR